MEDCDIRTESEVNVESVKGDEGEDNGLVRLVSCMVMFCEVILVNTTVIVWPLTKNETNSHYKQITFIDALIVTYAGTFITTLFTFLSTSLTLI